MLNRICFCLSDQRVLCISLCFIQIIHFLFHVGETMLDVTIRPHIVYLVCELHYSNNVCTHLADYPEYTNIVHASAGWYMTIYRLLVNIPTYICGLYLGPWSDVHGRKLPMVIPIIGSVLAVGVYTISTQVKDWAIQIVLAGTFVQGIFGKSAVISMAVNSYTSENSNVENRTTRLGRLLAMQYFGRCIGALLAGVMGFNIIAAFCVIGGIHLIGLFAVIIGVKGTNVKNDKEVKDTETHPCSKLYFLDGIKCMFFLITKQRPNTERCLFILILVIGILNAMNAVVQPDLMLFVVTGEPFNWSNSQYSYLLSFANISMGISLFVILPFLTNIIKLSDFDIMIFGSICPIVFCVSIQFATTVVVIYILMCVWSFCINIRICVRSILSKLVDNTDLGKLFSLLSCLETTSKVLGPLIYLNIYGSTLNINKYVVFYIMIGVCLINIGISGFAKYRHKHLLEGMEVENIIIENNDVSEKDNANNKTEKNKNINDHVTSYSTFK